MSEISIHAFRQSDEAALIALWNATMTRDPIEVGRFRSRVLFDENFDAEGLKLAECGGEIVGFVYGICRRHPFGPYGLQPDTGWITAFGSRRRGAATKLFEEIEAWFRAKGRTQILVSPYTPYYFIPGVDVEAYALAHKFLLARGYQPFGEAVGMWGPLLDITMPAELAEQERQLAKAGFFIEEIGPQNLLPLLEYLDTNTQWDWRRHVRERLARNIFCRDLIVARQSRTGTDRIIGFAHFEGDHFGPAEVQAEFRGKKLGALLFYRAIQRMRQGEFKSIWVAWTGGENIQFYQRAGMHVHRKHVLLRKPLA